MFQGTVRIFPKDAAKEFPAAQYMAESSLQCMASWEICAHHLDLPYIYVVNLQQSADINIVKHDRLIIKLLDLATKVGGKKRDIHVSLDKNVEIYGLSRWINVVKDYVKFIFIDNALIYYHESFFKRYLFEN